MVDLDEDVFRAFSSAVVGRRREEQWSGIHELLATGVEALWGIRSRLSAGIPVVNVVGFGSVDGQRYPRPSWVAQSTHDDIPTVTPRELAGRAAGRA